MAGLPKVAIYMTIPGSGCMAAVVSGATIYVGFGPASTTVAYVSLSFHTIPGSFLMLNPSFD